MSQNPLRREEVARIAIALKALRDFKDRDIHELVDTACDFLLFCGERALIAEEDHKRRKFRETTDRSTIISVVEAAKLITGQPESRARQLFDRFRKFLLEPNSLVPVTQLPFVCGSLKSGLNSGYQKDFCDLLTEIFPAWWKLEQSQLQAKRASKRYPKKS